MNDWAMISSRRGRVNLGSLNWQPAESFSVLSRRGEALSLKERSQRFKRCCLFDTLLAPNSWQEFSPEKSRFLLIRLGSIRIGKQLILI